MKNISETPSDGWKGFTKHFSADLLAGFSVFLLAMPLSLGIAKASDFPAIMGLVTAIIGGIVVSFFAGSRLTIKGPAAGLIVIVVSAVSDFGGGVEGWHLALGMMLFAAILQILFGLLKLGKLVDFFPLSAIHGMMAAIGLIIILKQIPVLLNVNPKLVQGKSPIDLLLSISNFFSSMELLPAILGAVCLLIMLLWNKVPSTFLRKIPAPVIVLLIAVPYGLYFDFQNLASDYTLVKIGNISESIHLQISLNGINQFFLFSKYVIMFALIGSIESLLTVKAIDLADPYKRRSDNNKDLIAIGIGNVLTSIIGGLPMISEVARSSANVNNGAKTRWANFYHGLFLLIFAALAVQWIELIPNAALAAMLISVGIKLAHPREFVHIYKVGREQLLIFCVTIFFTLFEDLLIGILAGITLKIIFHLINGAPLSSIFKAPSIVSYNENEYLIEIEKSAIFTNFLGIKSRLEALAPGLNVTIDFSKTKVVDYSVMESIDRFKKEYGSSGGSVTVIGLDKHVSMSKHPFSARKKKD